MIDEELFKLEREAENRIRETRDREIERGGPGSARRASEVMDASKLEVAAIRKMRRNLADLRTEIDHRATLLRRTSQNPDLPSDVKRYRIGQAETRLAELIADYEALKTEVERKFFPASAGPANPRIYYRDGVWIPARPGRVRRDVEEPFLPARPRPRRKTVPEFPLPRPRTGPDRAPVPDHGTERERSSPDRGNPQRFPDTWAAKGWGGPRGPYAVPTINSAHGRIANILADKPARFEIAENPEAVSGDPWYASVGAGKAAIASYGPLIDREARRQGVDPDLAKAIVFSENARGHYFGSARAAEGLGLADSYLPMNINPAVWGGLGIDERSADDPLTNIRAGVTLIRRISERIENPSAAKVASIWNFAGRERVNDFGAYVEHIYREKPWEDH